MRLDSRFPFVRAILRFDELDSTSDLARRILEKEPLDTPALIWADRQTRGRGQRDNTWWSDEGSLTATLVLDPRAIGLTLARESKGCHDNRIRGRRGDRRTLPRLPSRSPLAE